MQQTKKTRTAARTPNAPKNKKKRETMTLTMIKPTVTGSSSSYSTMINSTNKRRACYYRRNKIVLTRTITMSLGASFVGYLFAIYQLHDLSVITTIQIIMEDHHKNTTNIRNTNYVALKNNRTGSSSDIVNSTDRESQAGLSRRKQQHQQHETEKAKVVLTDEDTMHMKRRNNSIALNPIWDILADAKISVTDLSDDVVAKIPETWENMKQFYYTNNNEERTETIIMGENSNNNNNTMNHPYQKIVVYGTETCAEYQKLVPNKQDRIVAVAGLFNTGTNAMEFHLRNNINGIPSKWQVVRTNIIEY